MPTVKDIRSTIIEKLKSTMPEYIWTTGEPLVDIIDSIAEFHFKRETIVNLTQSLNKISGFSRLLYDASYRATVASVLGLSTTSRSKDYKGVPASVDNDLDAFIWYYLDRLGEKLGYKRGSGSSASATCYVYLPSSFTTGTLNLILKSGNRVYKVSSDVSTWTKVTSTLSIIETKIISFGYGSRYNALANTVNEIISIDYTVPITSDQINIEHEAIKNGSDYQTNNAFYQLMYDNSSASPGLGTRNNLATIISNDETVDKYLILGTDANRRFMGSVDIYLKTSVREVRVEQMVVGSDQKIVVPYQPAVVSGVTTTAGVAISYPTPTTIAGDFENTVKQNTYVDLSAAGIAAGTNVLLTFSLDTTCQNVNKSINDYYSSKYEYARDWLVHQAQPCLIDIVMTVKLKTAVQRDLANSLIDSKLNIDISDLSIYDGKTAGKIDGSDFIASVYNIYYNGDQLVDSFESLSIAKTTHPSPDDAIGATGTIYPDNIGEYFEINTLTITVI